jgi:hypothetical protein
MTGFNAILFAWVPDNVLMLGEPHLLSDKDQECALKIPDDR